MSPRSSGSFPSFPRLRGSSPAHLHIVVDDHASKFRLVTPGMIMGEVHWHKHIDFRNYLYCKIVLLVAISVYTNVPMVYRL